MLICDRLRNKFLVLRHGRSLANDQSLIVSSPKLGVNQYGLTPVGVDEVKAAVRTNQESLRSVAKIYASDFLRTRQTAEVVAETLGVELELTPALRERWFGDWEGKSNRYYETVWAADATDPTHQKWQVESVQQVADRTTELLQGIDETTVNQTYLLVSHGDPLQILLTAILGNDLRTHRGLEPLMTAEIRQIETD